MDIYNVTSIDKEKSYMSYNEAVSFLCETCGISEEDSMFFVDDYILQEASKEDVKKLADKGETVHDTTIGNKIVNKAINDPNNTKMALNRHEYFRKKNEEWIADPKNNFDPSKLDKDKDRTERDYIKDSTRTMDSSVPKYGANPENSRDADKKAVDTYNKAYRDNKYNEYDIDKSVKKAKEAELEELKRKKNSGLISEDQFKKKSATLDNKYRLVKSRMERGEDLFKVEKSADKNGKETEKKTGIDISKHLVRKDAEVPGEEKVHVDRTHIGYDKIFKNKEDEEEAFEVLQGLKTSTDPAEQKILRKKFLHLMGQDNYKGSILWPKVLKTAGGKNRFAFTTSISKEKGIKDEEKNDPNAELYHTSSAKRIAGKGLYPTTKGNEGVFYPDPAVYASRVPTDIHGNRIKSAQMKKTNVYTLDGVDLDNIKYDNNLINQSHGRAIKTSKAIPVTKISGEDPEEEVRPSEKKRKKLDTIPKAVKKTGKSIGEKISNLGRKHK